MYRDVDTTDALAQGGNLMLDCFSSRLVCIGCSVIRKEELSDGKRNSRHRVKILEESTEIGPASTKICSSS